ncbi:MAG: S41 family peptidase, partial [Calditrichota bacterium]
FDKLFKKSESDSKSKTDSESSKKKEEVKPVEIVFDGIKRRVRYLTIAFSYAFPVAIRPDSKQLIFYAQLVNEPYLWAMSLEEEKRGDAPKSVIKARGIAGDFTFSSDGKKVYFLRMGNIYSLGLNEDGGPKGAAKEIPVRGEVELDYMKLREQAFSEGWRVLRDYFYDPAFHGCDWNNMYDKFLPAVKGARTRRDFHDILNMMVGELNASHLGAYGYTGGQRNIDSFLGVDFERAPLEKKGQLKIRHVVADSPVTYSDNPPQVGEYIIAIDGKKLDARKENLLEILQRKDGKKMHLLVSPSSRKKGAREVLVKPMRTYRLSNLRYNEWVNSNADYVARKSNKRLGYVHIPSMSYASYLNFIADLDSEAYERDGVIIDVRFNGGGHIASFILDFLSRNSILLTR